MRARPPARESLALVVIVGVVLCGCNAKATSNPADKPALLKYATRYEKTPEYPEGFGCEEPNYRGKSSGYIELQEQEPASVRFEGLGCTIQMQREGGSKFVATDQACAFDGVVNAIGDGFLSMSFDALIIDLDGGVFQATGKVLRKAADAPLGFCFMMEGTVQRHDGAGGQSGEQTSN